MTKFLINRILSAVLIVITLSPIFGQDGNFYTDEEVIHLRNPSFEDIPRAGGSAYSPLHIRGWADCGAEFFRSQTPPDIHPTDGFAWSVDSRPQDGDTYLGMVVRFDDTQESLAQPLSKPLLAGSCYSFSVYLSMSRVYLSPTSRNRDINENFTTPTVLRIWGGNSYCDKAELLAESEPVNNVNWKPSFFKLKPKFNHRFILIEAYYETPLLFPYNGHILVDNCSPITPIECDKPMDEIVEEMQREETERVEEIAVNTPPPSTPETPTPPKPEEVKEQAIVEEKVDEPVEKFEPKILQELKEEKMIKGQTIRINNLYFKADSSNITDESFEVLDELANFLISHSNVVIEIGGHTATFVTPKFGLELSNARAKAVAEYLMDQGVSEKQLTYKGYGKEKPIVKNDKYSKRLQQKNQRVEIKVLSLRGEKPG